MKTLCIYHADCMDGAASAATVKSRYPNAILLPAQHGDKVPENLERNRIFIVDFSYSAPLLSEIKKKSAELYWFDHHKTALPIQKETGFGIIDLEESGATLTWKQLFPKTKVPKILQYVKDKDLWKWKLPHSREISADLRETENILNPSHTVWKKLLKNLSSKDLKNMIQRGHHSRRLLQERLEKAGTKGFCVNLDGIKAFAVNWTGDSSELGEYIYKTLKHPVALIFSYTGKEWSFSMRSNTVDVSEIAVRRGGGGHPGAAGFRTTTSDWLFAQRI